MMILFVNNCLIIIYKQILLMAKEKKKRVKYGYNLYLFLIKMFLHISPKTKCSFSQITHRSTVPVEALLG